MEIDGTKKCVEKLRFPTFFSENWFSCPEIE